MAVAEERDAGMRLVGDREQRAGGVLVEHPGLVDDQHITGKQPSTRIGTDAGCKLGVSPVAVLISPVAVLVDEPGCGERVGAYLLLRRLSGLEGGGDDHEPTAVRLV